MGFLSDTIIKFFWTLLINERKTIEFRFIVVKDFFWVSYQKIDLCPMIDVMVMSFYMYFLYD